MTAKEVRELVSKNSEIAGEIIAEQLSIKLRSGENLHINVMIGGLDIRLPSFYGVLMDEQAIHLRDWLNEKFPPNSEV